MDNILIYQKQWNTLDPNFNANATLSSQVFRRKRYVFMYLDENKWSQKHPHSLVTKTPPPLRSLMMCAIFSKYMYFVRYIECQILIKGQK